ncbi:MAG: hypothetical protein QXG91_00340 [Candidatus Aenigmatarchaeota archaeon]
MKAISFTLDLIVGISFAILIFLLAPIKLKSSLEHSNIFLLSNEANDIMKILSEVKAKEFLNISEIKEDDLENPILELIGSLWFSGNKSLASNITKEVISKLTKNCFSLDTENETIYKSCEKEGENKFVSFQISSGYQIGKPIKGYIARAWATKVIKNTTLIIPFYPSGSGWTGQTFELTKKFKLPNNITIINATLFISVHFGTTKSNVEGGAGFQTLKVNGIPRKQDVVWLYLEQEGTGSEITTAAYGYLDVTNNLNAGDNVIELSINTPNYHSHIHPGFRLVVTYNLSQDVSSGQQYFSKRYYFDNIIGRKGSWSMLSFFIPEDAENISAILHLNAKDIEDTYVGSYNTTDIIIYANSNTPIYMDSSGTGSDSCIYKSRYFCRRNIASTFNFRQYFNLTPYLVNGTNVVSIYINCCDYRNNLYDYEWGSLSSQIYSSPLDDPDNSSYVEVNYSLRKKRFEYGEIDITKEILFGGNPSNPKTFYYFINSSRSKITESFVHIAQGFSYMVNVTQKNPNGTILKVFTSPSGRVVPENVFVFPSYIGIGNNNITIRDFQPDGSTSPRNYILPYSSFEYTYLVKALVGYGNVFENLNDAINDAIYRLTTQIGEEGISASGISTDSQSIGDIKWMWGPAFFKLVLWQK